MHCPELHWHADNTLVKVQGTNTTPSYLRMFQGKCRTGKLRSSKHLLPLRGGRISGNKWNAWLLKSALAPLLLRVKTFNGTGKFRLDCPRLSEKLWVTEVPDVWATQCCRWSEQIIVHALRWHWAPATDPSASWHTSFCYWVMETKQTASAFLPLKSRQPEKSPRAKGSTRGRGRALTGGWDSDLVEPRFTVNSKQ